MQNGLHAVWLRHAGPFGQHLVDEYQWLKPIELLRTVSIRSSLVRSEMI